MNVRNTVNICIGHKPFPQESDLFYDMFLSRIPLDNPRDVIVTNYDYSIEHANALGEFVQLLWLRDNIKTIEKYDFVRIFHHSRFVSSLEIGKASQYPWIRILDENELPTHVNNFSRYSSNELFNQKYEAYSLHKLTLLDQYASSHQLKDITSFTSFLQKQKIFNKNECYDFLFAESIIPACSVGIFNLDTLIYLLDKIKLASEFIFTDEFVFREGFQSRNMAFLLERYLSCLILDRIRRGKSLPNFGSSIIFHNRYYE